MFGGLRLRTVLAMLGLLAVALAGTSVLLDDGEPSGATGGPSAGRSPLAGARDLRIHGDRSDTYLDGAVSLIRGDELWLYVVPARAEDPVVRFAIPVRTRRSLNAEHLLDPPAVRVYYRRGGARPALRGVAHRRSDGA